jgi:hypothetical protein
MILTRFGITLSMVGLLNGAIIILFVSFVICKNLYKPVQIQCKNKEVHRHLLISAYEGVVFL